MKHGIILTILVLSTLTQLNCSNACVALSEQICRCETSEALQRSCLAQVDIATSQNEVTPAEAETCEQLMDGCTCERLAAGELSACGLALE